MYSGGVGGGRPNIRQKSRTDAEALERYIEDQIRIGAWNPGQRLPTDRQLSELFDTARNTIRKTLDKFVSRGVIERHVGRGTFLTSESGDRPHIRPLQLLDASPADVIEARLLFEPAVVSLAVAKATLANVEYMEHCLAKGAEAGDWKAFEHWDNALHQAIADSTRNPAITQMNQSLSQVRNQNEWGQLKEQSLTVERRVQLQDEHTQIVLAIRKRNISDAQMWMRRHLMHVQSYMFRVQHVRPHGVSFEFDQPLPEQSAY